MDTPELAGEFLLKGDWSWTPSDGETSRWVMGYSSRNVAAFNYGRALRSPARAEVSGGTLNIPSGAITYIVQSAGAAFSHDQWGLITVGRVATTPGSIVTAAYADRDPSVHSGGPVRIDVDRMDFTGIGDNILVIDTGDSGTGSLGTVAIRDCTGVHLKLPERGMSSITVDRTEVRRVFRSAASAAPADIGLTFRDSTMQAVNFNGTHWADFSRCTWRGASSATALSMDLRVKSYLSNLHANGATGHPTHPDGYRNTTYYKAA